MATWCGLKLEAAQAGRPGQITQSSRHVDVAEDQVQVLENGR